MNNELCFLIENKTLHLNKVLVAFNEFPIFFICTDDLGDYYIALCIDIEDSQYYIVKCPLRSLHQMLTGKIEMRVPFTSADYFWYVKAGKSVEEDQVVQREIKHLNLDDLPYPNAYYKTITTEDIEYVSQITKQIGTEGI